MSEDRGTYIRYVERNFGHEALETITAANRIIAEYEQDNLTLTLRQLYYQFVARGLMANDSRNYNRLGGVINDGRMAGLVSWTAIEDRTRGLRGLHTYDSPAAALRAARDNYRTDLWAGQPWRPEVWIEKDALVGVLEDICARLRVDFYACRGYNSQSEAWRAGQRFAGYVAAGQRPIVFHLGDHDPSGLDMTRDNRDRLTLFCGVPVQVVRLALNMDQVRRYNPPPNPAKLTDSRAAGYIAEYGDLSWELDALDPKTIRDLISDAVMRVRDETLWSAALAEEAADIDRFDRMIEEMET